MSDSIVSLSEIKLNEVKPFIIANVNLQCEKDVTSRISIVGSPGCGKSDLIRQICEENGWGLVVKYLSNMSLEQITGIPCKVEDGEHARFTKPELFNFDSLDYKPDKYILGETTTILLIDDFHLADKIIQKYLFQLLTYKSINSYKLPPKCAIILAGNKITDKALAHTIPAPVMNRIAVYEVKADVKDWLENYAFSHGVRHDIMSFINSVHGEKCFVQEPIESAPWASPRSWTFLSEQLDAYQKLYKDLSVDKLKLIANSLIGASYATEFIAYREIFSKYNARNFVGKPSNELVQIFTAEVSKSSVSAYAIINVTMAWMIEEAKKLEYDVENEKLLKVLKATYNVITAMLMVNVPKCNIKPFVVTGTNYIYSYGMSLKSSDDRKKYKALTRAFMRQVYQKRDIDWIYYEIIANVFEYPLDDADKDEISKAKANINID